MLRERISVVALFVAVVGLAVTPAAAVGGHDAGLGTAEHAVEAQSDCSFPVTATDATGTEVTIEERPERVTTLAPSAAQTVWDIGGKEQVVGVTQFASYLADAGERANVSAAGRGVSVEKVVATEPDLVLAPNVTPDDTVASLRDAGVTVFKFEGASSIEDVAAKTTLIGQLTGNCAGAAELNTWMNANVEEAQRVTADRERVSVLYPLGGGFYAGRGTFINAVLRAAGAENALPEEDAFAGFPEVNDETVIASEPDALVVTAFTSTLLGSQPLSELEAVQNDRTVRVDRNWMNQPAPRSVVFATRNLTTGLHPDAADAAEFPSRGEVSVDTPTTATTETTTSADGTETETPGFGAVLALVAVVAAGLLGFRRS